MVMHAMSMQCSAATDAVSTHKVAHATAGVTPVRAGAGRLPAACAGRGRGRRVAAPADAPGQAGRQGACRAGGRGLRNRRPRRPARGAARAAAHAAQRPCGACMQQPGSRSHAGERHGRVCGPPAEAAGAAGRKRRQAGHGRHEVGLRQAAAADGGGRGRGGRPCGERRGRARQCGPGEACKAAAGALTAARAAPGVPALQLSSRCKRRTTPTTCHPPKVPPSKPGSGPHCKLMPAEAADAPCAGMFPHAGSSKAWHSLCPQ